MRVYDLKDTQGRLFAFEVPNIVLGRRGVARVVEQIVGVRIMKSYKIFSLDGDDEFCHFEVDGAKFVVWEPWGDSNRYWVGPAESRTWLPQNREGTSFFGFVW